MMTADNEYAMSPPDERISADAWRVMHQNIPWRPICGPHNCHPKDCFHLHYPEASRDHGDFVD